MLRFVKDISIKFRYLKDDSNNLNELNKKFLKLGWVHVTPSKGEVHE